MDGKVLGAEKEGVTIATLPLDEARAKIVGILVYSCSKILKYFTCTRLKNC